MLSPVHAYYHRPTIWFEEIPVKAFEFDVSTAEDVVATRTLGIGVVVQVQRQGLVELDFTGWKGANVADSKAMDFDEIGFAEHRRQLLMDVHLGCVHAAAVEIGHFALGRMTITPEKRIAKDNLGGTGGSPGNDLPIELLLTGLKSTYNPARPIHVDPRLLGRVKLPIAAAERSLELLDNASGVGMHLLEALALVNRAAKELEDHNSALSLVASWAVCERMLNLMWENMLAKDAKRDVGNDRKFITSKRLDSLNGRDFTASVMTEVLSLRGDLEFDLYAALGEVRRARNAWMHGSESELKLTLAAKALRVAAQCVWAATGFPVTISIGLQARA